MISYVGHKPKNWAGAVLVYGWLGASVLLIGAGQFGLLDGISLFRRDLAETPLTWEAGLSFVGFAFLMSPLVLGALALWLVPASGHAPAISWTLVILGVTLPLAGWTWEARSGRALYADRVVSREAGFTSSLREHRFRDLVRVEVSCVATKRRRSSRYEAGPYYWMVFRDGYETDGWSLANESRQSPRAFLRQLDVMHDAAEAAGVVRAPKRRSNGEALWTIGCLSRLAEQLGVTIQRLQPYLVVHQSELREGEYRVVQTPSRGTFNDPPVALETNPATSVVDERAR
jgi:hypothetical protein